VYKKNGQMDRQNPYCGLTAAYHDGRRKIRRTVETAMTYPRPARERWAWLL